VSKLGNDPSQATRDCRIGRTVDAMARIVVFVVAAVAIVALAWVLFWGLLHLVIIGLAIVLVGMLGMGMFRVGRWAGRGSRQ
jgi:hypothetical protein